MARALSEAENGSRYMIYVAWDNGTAHVYNAEKQYGMTLYFDAQNPKAKPLRYLQIGVEGKFGLLRVDDKQITTDTRIISEIMEAAP